MSILIKGMKMPKTCTMCWLSPICPVWVKEVSRHKGYDYRLPDCPLVEVPPHGRLIDGDNVIKLLREQLTGDRDTVYEYYDDGLEMAISELSIVPTIIEAEGEEDHEHTD